MQKRAPDRNETIKASYYIILLFLIDKCLWSLVDYGATSFFSGNKKFCVKIIPKNTKRHIEQLKTTWCAVFRAKLPIVLYKNRPHVFPALTLSEKMIAL